MKRRKVTIFAATAVLGLVLTLVIAVILLNPSGNKIDIILPDTSPVSTGEVTGGNADNSDGLIRAEVNNKTVKAVIEYLKRPESYYRSFKIESFWDLGNSVSVYMVDIYVKGDKSRIEIYHEGFETQNLLITDEKVYFWYTGDNIRELNRWNEEDIIQTVDGFQMIATYEDILEADEGSIIDSGFKEKRGKYYVYVQTEDQLMGYLTSYYVSIESGLLEYSEKYDGDLLVYRMTLLDQNINTQPDNMFELP